MYKRCVKVSVSRKSSAAGPQEEGKHAVSKFRKAVSMKIAVKDRKRCSFTAEFDRRKIPSKSKVDDESKSL